MIFSFRWYLGQYQIHAYDGHSYRLLIEVVRGRFFRSDLAVDDITVSPGICSERKK